MESIRGCIEPNPVAFRVKRVYDYKSWISQVMDPLHDHSIPKCFKFQMGKDGKAEMFHRNWTHHKWMGPTQLLKVCQSLYCSNKINHFQLQTSLYCICLSAGHHQTLEPTLHRCLVRVPLWTLILQERIVPTWGNLGKIVRWTHRECWEMLVLRIFAHEFWLNANEPS